MPLSAEFKYILRNRSFLNFLGFSALINKAINSGQANPHLSFCTSCPFPVNLRFLFHLSPSLYVYCESYQVLGLPESKNK